MSRYRKVRVRMWGDLNFRSLSAPPPNAQTLWMYLLTGPETTIIPGLLHASVGSLMDGLGWGRQAVLRCFKEISDKNMARADWEHRLIWLPNGPEHNPPESPNVVAAWRDAFEELPECPLRSAVEAELSVLLLGLGERWIAAWEAGAIARSSRPSREVLDLVRRRDGDFCRYCGQMVNWKDRRGKRGGTFDHVAPRGPSTEDNIVVACRGCNSTKGLRSLEQASMVLLAPRLDPDATQVGQQVRLDSSQVEPGNQEQGTGTGEGAGGSPRTPPHEASPRAKPKRPAPSPVEVEVIGLLNGLAGTTWKSGMAYGRELRGRIADGYTLEDFDAVVRLKVSRWKDDDRLRENLNPTTLFRKSNFERYLEETRHGRVLVDDAPRTDAHGRISGPDAAEILRRQAEALEGGNGGGPEGDQ